MTTAISPEVNLTRIYEYGPLYAKAKAERVQIEEFRKSLKAMLMKKAMTAGHATTAAQEREAYADPEYITLLDGLKAAVEQEERYRWGLTLATTAIEVWRSQEASNRAMDRSAA